MRRLKELREARGLSQMDLAKAVDVSQQAVAKWEVGEAFPRAEKLPQLTRALGCTIDDLFRDDDNAASGR